MDEKSKIIIQEPQLCPILNENYAFYLAREDTPFVLNGETVTVEQDDGLFVNIGQIVDIKKTAPCLLVNARFPRERIEWQGKLIDRIQDKKSQPYFVLRDSVPRQKAVLDGLRLLVSAVKVEPDIYPYLAPGVIYSMFQALVEEIDENCTLFIPEDDFLRCTNIMKYFTQHYKEHLKLEEVSAVFGYTENTAIACFPKYVGTTPIDYLNVYRVNQACHLLRTTDMKMGDVGAAVGIPINSYFSTIFKRTVGMSPSMYRKTHAGQPGMTD